MRNLSLCTVCLLLLTLLLGKINPLAAQADFSNWILTTDCCPKEKNRIDSIMNNAPFVFEGRMIKMSYGHVYNSYLFEIEKIYRGGERLQAGTVEIISKMPNNSSDPNPVGFGYSRYIIFAKEINSITVHRYKNIDKYGRAGNVNIFNIDTLGVFDANNSLKLEVFYHDYFHVTSLIGEVKGPYFSPLGITFKTRKEMLDFLSGYGLSPTDMLKADTLKNLSKQEIEDIKKRKEKNANKKIIPYVSPEKMDSIVREMKKWHGLDTLQNKKTGKTQKSGNDSLYMMLGNVKNTVDSIRRYLEFDIIARADVSGTYIPSMTLILYYESDSITVDSTTLQITQGDFFQRAAACDYWMLYTVGKDINNKSFIQITLTDTCKTNNSYNYKEMPITDTELANLKIMVTKNTKETAVFSFLDPVTDEIQSIINYSTQATTLDPFPPPYYDLHIQPSPVYTLSIFPKPVISNYYINTPGNTVGCAGCGDVLVIQGNNFETKDRTNPNDTSATLAFKLGDFTTDKFDTIPHYKLKENYDYVSWTNTEIRVKLPSHAINTDQDFISSDPSQNYPDQYPGTGTFKVINSLGREATSDSIIRIDYVLKNTFYVDNADRVKYFMPIPKRNCINGYRFQINSALEIDTAALACIKKALRDMSTTLGIELSLAVDSVGNPIVNTNPNWDALDDINTISLKNCSSSEGMMTTQLNPATGCGSPAYKYYTDFDIEICNRNNWYKDTNGTPSSSQYCFYSTFLHELGHVLGLRHVINVGDLMTKVASLGVKDSLTGGALAGLQHIVNENNGVPGEVWEACGNDFEVLNSPNELCGAHKLPPLFIYCTHIAYDEIKVEWNSMSGAIVYILEYSSNQFFFPIIGRDTILYGTTSKIFTGLAQGTTYHFRIIASNSTENLGYGTTKARTPCQTGGKPIDLMIKRTSADIGTEPYTSGTGLCLWSSPDIWVRNSPDDGMEHQSPIPNDTNYVYVRIQNIGCTVSTGREMLKLYWSKAATSLAWDYHWTGNRYEGNGPLLGNIIDSLFLPIIPSGETVIVKIPWLVPDPSEYLKIINEAWHFCLLARIEANDDPIVNEVDDLYTNVNNNNNIAWKNVHLIRPSSGRIGGSIAVGNVYNTTHSFDLQFSTEEEGDGDDDDDSSTLIREAEITINLNSILYQAWKRGGALSEGVEIKGNRVFIIKGENAVFRNLTFEPYEIGALSLCFNFLTREMTDQANYTFHVIQSDYETDDIIGGEVYSITKSPRTPFYADAGGAIYAYSNENIQLNAASIGEDATYNWYLNDNLVHTGMSFTTPAVIGRKYKLEVIALSDGYKDYAEVEIKENWQWEICALLEGGGEILDLAIDIIKENFPYLLESGVELPASLKNDLVRYIREEVPNHLIEELYPYFLEDDRYFFYWIYDFVNLGLIEDEIDIDPETIDFLFERWKNSSSFRDKVYDFFDNIHYYESVLDTNYWTNIMISAFQDENVMPYYIVDILMDDICNKGYSDLICKLFTVSFPLYLQQNMTYLSSNNDIIAFLEENINNTYLKNTKNNIIEEIENTTESIQVTIYPNPNNGTFTISTNFDPQEITSVQVFTSLGISVYQQTGLQKNIIQLPQTAKGIYFVEIFTASQKYIRKIVVL